MKKTWKIFISVNDEEYYSMLIVKAKEVKNIGYDEETCLYALKVDNQLLYFDEPIVEINEEN